MPKLTIVAHVTAKPESIDLVRAELLALIDPTRVEEGCLQYDLHLDNQEPAHFMFYENWESRELWQRHMDSPHLAAFKAATDGALASMTIHEMTPIG